MPLPRRFIRINYPGQSRLPLVIAIIALLLEVSLWYDGYLERRAKARMPVIEQERPMRIRATEEDRITRRMKQDEEELERLQKMRTWAWENGNDIYARTLTEKIDKLLEDSPESPKK